MKFPIFYALTLCAITVVSCRSGQAGAPAKDNPTRKAETISRTITLTEDTRSDTIDFGRLHEGEVIEQRIMLRNGTRKPMIIVSASTNCGCTGTDYERHPIKPNGEGFFSFIFNSRGFMGYQFKQITVRTTLSSKPFVLILTGEVVP